MVLVLMLAASVFAGQSAMIQGGVPLAPDESTLMQFLRSPCSYNTITLNGMLYDGRIKLSLDTYEVQVIGVRYSSNGEAL